MTNLYSTLLELDSLNFVTPFEISPEKALEIKNRIASIYEQFGFTDHPHFMNWGIYSKSLFKELSSKINLTFFFNPLSDYNSHLLFYYMLRPLMLSGVQTNQLSILEVGCGNGAGLAFMNKLMPIGSSVGIDICPVGIERANMYHKTHSSISFEMADAEALPYESNSFDIILSLEASHCFPNPEKFFNEVFRVLKPGGKFLYADLTIYSSKGLETLLQRVLVEQSSMKIIKHTNLTRLVQNSIHLRLIKNEMDLFSLAGRLFWGSPTYLRDIATLMILYGIMSLPKRKWALKHKGLKDTLLNLSKNFRTSPKRLYFYYCLEK